MPVALSRHSAGQAYGPARVRTKPDGTDVHTLWGELAWQLLGAEGYQLVAESDRSGTSPGSDALVELFRAAGPSLILIDAVTRLIPGVLGDPTGAVDDSHASGLLEYPHYTRPAEFRGWKVPEVLLSGNHAAINRWRRNQALARTFQRRPDMLARFELNQADRDFLKTLSAEQNHPSAGEEA